LPAIVALAADPLASLVDTAFIGQIGMLWQSLLKARRMCLVYVRVVM
jgi:hypothetical protein